MEHEVHFCDGEVQRLFTRTFCAHCAQHSAHTLGTHIRTHAKKSVAHQRFFLISGTSPRAIEIEQRSRACKFATLIWIVAKLFFRGCKKAVKFRRLARELQIPGHLAKEFQNTDSCEFHRNSVFRAVTTTELCIRFGEVVKKPPPHHSSLAPPRLRPIFEPRF